MVLFLLRLDCVVIKTYKRLLDIIVMKSHLEVLHFELFPTSILGPFLKNILDAQELVL